MRIWIDLANSPHVPFFRSIANEFVRRNHEIVVTAREFAETVELANSAGFVFDVIGGHGGGKLSGKAGNLVQRGLALARWARGREIDIAVSHNSYSQILAARALGLRTVTLMDYEHQPANHLAFRLATRIIVPTAFPEIAFSRFGGAEKVRRYEGIKEDAYLAGFQRDANFVTILQQLGINEAHILVVARPPATEALYHRFENELFDRVIERVLKTPATKIVILPRNELQRAQYSSRKTENLIVPSQPLDGPNLIAHSDLVVSAGGTMNREAAALGTPAVSVFKGEWAAVDEQLVKDGRLRRISKPEEVDEFSVQKKTGVNARQATHVSEQIAGLILES